MRPDGIRQGDIPGVQARRRRTIPAPAETLWRWLREPQRLAAWLDAEVEPVAGSLEITGRDRRGPYVDSLEIIEERPPLLLGARLRRLSPRWPEATRLVFEISRQPEGGAEISILHAGFEQLPLSECLTHWEDQRRRWQRALERLADLAARGH